MTTPPRSPASDPARALAGSANNGTGPPDARGQAWKIAVYWLALAAVWVMLSGRFDVLHLGTGIATALVIAMQARRCQDGTRFHPTRFLRTLPWLAGQVVVSNLSVARSVLDPRLPVDPALVRVRPGLSGDRELAMLGASITLTPGTLTVNVDRGEMLIHVLDRRSVDDLRRGKMGRRIGRVFGKEAGWPPS